MDKSESTHVDRDKMRPIGSLLRSVRSHKKAILLMAVTAAATLVVSSLVSVWLCRGSKLKIPSSGIIRFEGVEGYWDKNLTNKTGQEAPCNWGLIWPGAAKNLTLYLRSISNVDTNFTLTETDLTYYNSNYKVVLQPSSNVTQSIWLTWDYDNSTVHPYEILQVTLTLHASFSSDFIEFLVTNDVKTFSFDINISAR